MMDTLGAAKAASIPTGLCVLHNVLYAAFSMIAGWLTVCPAVAFAYYDESGQVFRK